MMATRRASLVCSPTWTGPPLAPHLVEAEATSAPSDVHAHAANALRFVFCDRLAQSNNKKQDEVKAAVLCKIRHHDLLDRQHFVVMSKPASECESHFVFIQ